MEVVRVGGEAFSFGSRRVCGHVGFKSKKGEGASLHTSSGYLVNEALK